MTLWKNLKACWFQLLFLALSIVAAKCGLWDAAGALTLGMILPPRDKVFRPAELNPGTNLLLGTTFEKELPGNFPYEGIDIVCDFALSATAPTPTLDGLLKFVKRVEIESRSPINPGVIVNASGLGLLELSQNTRMNHDAATLSTIAKQVTGFTNSALHRIVFPVDFVPPQIGGQLRSRFLLDCNNHKAPPKIKIDFGTSAELVSAQSVTTINVHLELRRKFMGELENKALLRTGGYIPTDLLEQTHASPAGQGGEKAFKLFTKGKMLGVNMRMYKGGATVTRGDISEVLTVGSETIWKLDVGGTPVYEWTMKGQKAKNDRSRPLNSADVGISTTAGASPNIGPLRAAAATWYQDVPSVYLDFLSDEGGTVDELGSILDIDEHFAQNNEVAIIGNVSNPATNGHTIYLLGHRIINRLDVSQWQAMKQAIKQAA